LSVSKVQITSSGVIVLPSCQRASARRLKVIQERSCGTSMVSQIRAIAVNGSSSEPTVSVS
jgi:hypothetical protein